MRLRKLTLRGWIGIQRGLGCDEIEIDFTRFSSGLVLFAGTNGSGKSTILENCHPYLQLASRTGALTNHVYLKDSKKELEFEWGHDLIKCVVLLDAKSKTTQAFLSVNDVLQNDGKTSTYNEVVTRLFGSDKLFFHSVFSAQHRTPLTDLTKGERKELFTELLGLDYLQEIAEVAKRTGDLHSNSLQTLNAQLLRVDVVQKELEENRVRRDSALLKQKEWAADQTRTTVAFDMAQVDLTDAQEVVKSCELKFKVEESRAKQRAQLERTLVSLEVERQQLEREVQELCELRDKLPQLTEKHRYLQDVDVQINEIEQSLTKARTIREEALEQRNRLENEKRGVAMAIREKQQLIQTLQKQSQTIDLVPCTEHEELFTKCRLLESAHTARSRMQFLTGELNTLEKDHPEWDETEKEIEKLLQQSDPEVLNKDLNTRQTFRRTLLSQGVVEEFTRAKDAVDRLVVLGVRFEEKSAQIHELQGQLAQQTPVELSELKSAYAEAQLRVLKFQQDVNELRSHAKIVDQQLVQLSTTLRELSLQDAKLNAELGELEEKRSQLQKTLVDVSTWHELSKVECNS